MRPWKPPRLDRRGRSSVQRSLCSHASPSPTAFLADKAITYLKRHPHQLRSLLSQFTPDSASDFLLKSQTDQNLTLNFLNWARSSSFSFFDSRCKCYALHVLTKFKLYKTAQSIAEDLAREAAATHHDVTGSWAFSCLRDSYQNFNSSSAVFDLMVKSYSCLNMIDKAMNTIRLAKVHGFMPAVLSYNSVLDAVIKSQGPLLRAEEVYNDMRNSGISPNVFTYNILIRGCCGAGELRKGLGFFALMERHGCLPNVVTFNTLMDAYCKLGRIDDVFTVFQAMRSKHLEPNLITYNVLVNGLCREGRMKEANQVVDEMKWKGLLPDEVTYNTLVSGYCKEGSFHQALVSHAEMLTNGLSPNVITYTALINSMCKSGNLLRAMEFLEQMCARGLQPNERTYTTLIDGFSQQGSLNEGYRLLKEMLEGGFTPSVVTYNSLINGYCVLGKMEEALSMISDMEHKGLTPDVITYSTIVSGFCKNRDLDRAFLIKQEMVSRGVLPDAVTFSSLIQGLCQQRKLPEACRLFEEMLCMGLSPDEFTFTALIGAYCLEGNIEQALHLHNEMIQKGFLPDAVTYSVLINGLNKQARTREAKRLLLKLFDEESVTSDITYNTLIESCSNIGFKSVVPLIKGFCMKGLMTEADRVFELMLQRNCRPTEAVYNVLIHGHCKGGNLPRAYHLYREMMSTGFIPHTTSVIALIKALFMEGMSEELGEVVENLLRSCKLTDGELAKALVEVNHREGNMDAVFNVLTEMAKDGLLPNCG